MAKILLLEDEAHFRNIFLELLEAAGFEAMDAENWFVAVQLAREWVPDLIVCNTRMLKLNVYSVLNILRRDPITAIIPLIGLIAEDSEAELYQSIELAVDGYLMRTTTIETLRRTIAAHLEKQAARREGYALWSNSIQGMTTISTRKPTASQSIFPNIPRLAKVFQFIESNYHDSISLCEVAREVGYSPAYLTNLVRQLTGKTVNQWILEYRLSIAQTLLLETEQSVNEIALRVGYQNPGHFFRQFRDRFRITPQAWRKAQHGIINDFSEIKQLQHSMSVVLGPSLMQPQLEASA